MWIYSDLSETCAEENVTGGAETKPSVEFGRGTEGIYQLENILAGGSNYSPIPR